MHSFNPDNMIIKDCSEVNILNGFKFDIVKKKKEIYCADPAAFDIETTSFYEHGEKRALMYVWQFGFCGYIFIGRTWTEFINFIDALHKIAPATVICYVHNLAYEFQFIRKYFIWKNVFSLSTRKPVYAESTSGILFKCSYILTASSLDSVGKNLIKYKVKKAVGLLDYDLIRNSSTPLTSDEILYICNDIKVVLACIYEKIENEGDILKIPLTNTGYVRRFCKKECLEEEGISKRKSKKFWKYHHLMQRLQLSEEEYKLNQRAFQGGYTHACPRYSGQVVNDVGSIDFTSSYPYALVSEPRYPMGRGQWQKIQTTKELLYNLKHFACIFDIKFIGIQSSVEFDNYISSAHCWSLKNPVINNGRVYSADELTTTITEIDFSIIQRMYKWESIEIGKFIRYARSYLPTDFVKAILTLYKDKTVLKDNTNGDSFLEREYMLKKGMLNSCYGMTVTNIVRDEITYNTDWGIELKNYADEIEKYNSTWGRFLFYPWGIYCTAISRRNIFDGIFEFSNEFKSNASASDYIYSDTDSIKCTNINNHMEYINQYNQRCRDKLQKAMEWHKLPFELCEPTNAKGKKILLGAWDIEKPYNRFKSLGAKRYMYEQDGHINITVSGLNKKTAVPYLYEEYKTNDAIFAAFEDGLKIDKEHTGKLTHTYIDDEHSGYITDYLGNIAEYHELSCIHLNKQDYELSISNIYEDFLEWIAGGFYEVL